MPRIKNEIYYHIHTVGVYDDDWKVGAEFMIPNGSLNNFTRKYEEDAIHSRLKSGDMHDLDFLFKIDKEEKFEEIRKRYFPHKPSRRNCIWVCTYQDLKFWIGELSNSKKLRVFKLELTGRCHKADNRNFTTNFTQKNYTEKLYKYWEEITERDDYEGVEILFEGSVKVLEEIDIDKID